jgi:membrane-associated phospholipid phosphatase
MTMLSPLLDVLFSVLSGVAVLLIGGGIVIVGPDRFQCARRHAGERLRTVGPHLAALAAVLLVNKVARDIGPEVSWIVGINITGAIYAVEGSLVGAIQSLGNPMLTAYFSFVYLVGYVFLLVFPFVAYFALEDLRPFRWTAIAFVLNYGIGLLCYVVFIAYGPRNLIPDLVDPLLYETFPRSQILTGQVNVNTNVFPSLHTSLSLTVVALAWRTRESYPLWTPVATILGGSIAVGTMYLGIHWATDVFAGAILGLGSAALAIRHVE